MNIIHLPKSAIVALACIMQSAYGTHAVAANQMPGFSGSASFVTFTPEKGATCLWNASEKQVGILTDESDYPGVLMAASNLMTDIESAGGKAVYDPRCATQIVIGTLGRCSYIDSMVPGSVKRGLTGKREKYIITTLRAYIGGAMHQTVVVAGSDKRGTIYGIYELSRQLGISPWYWWADVPVERHEAAYVRRGIFTEGEPAVRYRGIFINDEWPAMGNWANEHFGDFNHQMYAHVFELVLRLKGNFMWPAMWNSAFYADDPENMTTADEMGIIMGTSHHEPLGRAQKEWTRVRTRGPWNYDTNHDELTEFWRGGVARMRNTEDVLTIGMRGNGDEPMAAHADVALLERIVAEQREIIAQETGRPAEQTPQVWALYKEVQEYYEKGMRLPDDVILLLCDDNWGDVRLLPDLGGKHHPGGYGMYYHVDYVGGPRNSKWLNVSQVQRMWEQLQLTYDYGVDQLWILNVGDLKPMEFPIDFFLKMAWNPSRFKADNLIDYTRDFCLQQLGESQADEAARILNLQCKYAYRKTAELLDQNSYSLQNGEWQQMVSRYRVLAYEAEGQFATIEPQYRDTYRQLILFPVQAMANIYELHYAYAMYTKLTAENNPEADTWARKAYEYYVKDSVLCAQYNHDIASGKWNHMMDQLHIGYTSWQEPSRRYFPTPSSLAQRGRGTWGATSTPKETLAYEATDFTDTHDAKHAKWTIIPYFGIYDNGVALMPYTKPTDGASITYHIDLPRQAFTLRLQLAPTLPFNAGKGQRLKVRLADTPEHELNINQRFNEYALQGNRINTQDIKYDNTDQHLAGRQQLTLMPLDPGIVIERIEVVWEK